MTKKTNESNVDFQDLPLEEQLKLAVGNVNLNKAIVSEGVPYAGGGVLNNNLWYRRISYGLILLLVLMVVAISALAWSLSNVAMREPLTLTYSIDSQGNIVELEPIDRPGVTDAKAASWAVNSAINIQALSFYDYEDHIASLKSTFTPKGHTNYVNALRSSAMFRRVVDNNLTSWAEPVTAPIVTFSDLNEGVYTWRVEFDMRLFIGGGNIKTQPTLVKVTAIVKRTTTPANNYGLLIDGYIAQPYNLGAE